MNSGDKMTHTPGPWGWDAGDIGTDYSIPYCTVTADGDEVTVAEVNGNANARLIAAAPELLAALEAFVTQATKVRGFPQAYEPYVGALVAARAAIDKATNGKA